MSCATKIGYSMTVEMPLALITRGAQRLIGEGPYRPFKVDPKSMGHRDIVESVVADSEHRDPVHVWGDEGPVND